MTPPINTDRKEIFDMAGKLYSTGCIAWAAGDKELAETISTAMGAMVHVLLMNVPDEKITTILALIKHEGPEQIRTE